MKQKINVRLVVVAILAAMLTMLGIITVCYGLFRNQVEKDLRIRILDVDGHLVKGKLFEILLGGSASYKDEDMDGLLKDVMPERGWK